MQKTNNFYQITSIDPATNAVYVHFEYNGHILDHTAFPDNVDDPIVITSAVNADYKQFTVDMDAIDNAPIIPADVSSLIGVKEVQ